MTQNQETSWVAGITWRSLCATIFCMLVMGMYLQYAEIIQVSAGALGEQSLPVPAVTVFVVVLILAAACRALFKHQLLTRQELWCVLFAMLIAAPMMTQGMWHRFVGVISATPRMGNFHYIDALSDKLWPHGQNLIEDGLADSESIRDHTVGTVAWERIEYEADKNATLPVMRNSAPDDVSSVSLRIPTEVDGHRHLIPGNPYLVSLLVRPANLSPDSSYFARIHVDNEETYQEIINQRDPSKTTFLHQKGFLRIGMYGVDIPSSTKEGVRLEVGLSGVGELAVYDPKFFDVSALEGVYKGRRIIDESDYRRLPDSEQSGLIVKPDNMWSLSGLKFLITGYIPLSDWGVPALAWSTPIVLLLAGLFAVAVIMRRQWAENERYPFPMVRILSAMNGEPEELEDNKALSPVWRNWLMWAGFGAALTWGLMKGWSFYNPKVPNMAIEVPLSQYLSDPGWGEMWKQVRFIVSGLLLSICIFFELNVLLSFVVGFFMFRSLYWIGQFSGLNVHTGYPFRYEQALGSYIAYAAVILFFVRKYLWNVVKDAIRRNKEASGDEPITYRTALIVIVAAFVGVGVWARWIDVSVSAILVYFSLLMVIGFVAAKIRCECGLPAGYFTPYNAMLFMSLLGGMQVFGASSVMVCLIASGFLTVSVFFFIPGTQIELIEYGRRYQIKGRHVVYTVALGILGGLFVGGWVFLSNAYAIGGDNIKYQWAFGQSWFFSAYKSQLAATTSSFLQADTAQTASTGVQAATWAYVYGGLITVVLAVLRQLFAGFWFHPVGFMLGSAHMLEWAWGSALLAWCIRSVVLKFGGAATVKNKLFPFFTGAFLGSLASILFFVIYGAWLEAQGVERIFSAMP